MGSRHWTKEEFDLLDTLVNEGHGYRYIAKKLNRTYAAVRQKALQQGTTVRLSPGCLSTTEVCALFGISSQHIVHTWIATKMLKARNAGSQQNKLWRVRWESISDFIANPNTWMAWECSQITDLALREWATELRGNKTYWVRSCVAANLLSASPGTVSDWARSGALRAFKYQAAWWVWVDDIPNFVPPGNKSRKGKSRKFGKLSRRVLEIMNRQPMTTKDLQDRLGGRTWGIYHALKRLEALGYIRRTYPYNRRDIVWVPTESQIFDNSKA